jgi:hypothetical protein
MIERLTRPRETRPTGEATRRHRIVHNATVRSRATESSFVCQMAHSVPAVRFRVPFDQRSSSPTVFEHVGRSPSSEGWRCPKATKTTTAPPIRSGLVAFVQGVVVSPYLSTHSPKTTRGIFEVVVFVESCRLRRIFEGDRIGMCCRLRTEPYAVRSYDETAHEGDKIPCERG